MKYLPSFKRVALCFSLLGAAVLIYILGAASMYFGFPLSNFLTQGFQGAEQWVASLNPPQSEPERPAVLTVNEADATYDGFTLVTTTSSSSARLLDMDGNIVQHWQMLEKRPWVRAPHVPDPAEEEPTHWERCHVFPNGDILALVCKGVGQPYGYGIAKFDEDSNLIWGFSDFVHHDFDVGPDGNIYVLTHRAGFVRPQDWDWMPANYRAEFVVVLSEDGKEIDRVSILDAFHGTPFAHLLKPVKPGDPNQPVIPGQVSLENTQARQHGQGNPVKPPVHWGQGPPPTTPDDVLHSNSVRVLSDKRAAKFPLFKAGQVLLSLRTPSVLAVLDLPTRSIVWATRGPWCSQHDANFLDNGNLLIFDNFGTPTGSRVVEYDPIYQAVRWAYAGENTPTFKTAFRGTNQRLPNGNTLIVESDNCRVFEVTLSRSVVWEWGSGRVKPATQGQVDAEVNYTGAKRYGPDYFSFLKGGPHERPRPERRNGGGSAN